MKKEKQTSELKNLHWFEKISLKATKGAGSSTAFIAACIGIIAWFASGPFFDFSDDWRFILHITTGIVTFLMVFLIQKTQNRDSIALQVKLNELVAAISTASNRALSVEDLSEAELERLNQHYTRLAEMTKRDRDKRTTRSIEDALPGDSNQA
jgi:low affinity Fe/Cu permease